MHLPDFVKSVKGFVADDQLLLAIGLLKERLPSNSFKYDDLLLLEGRLQHLAGRRLRGALLEEQAQVGYARIREDLLLLIDSLTAEELRNKQYEMPRRGYGQLLYRIPRQMQLSVQVACLVRIAKLKKLVREGLPDDAFTELREVKVSRTMAVDLLDPSQDAAFQISAVQDTVQMLEDDDYTEWRFYVTPRTPGTHPLLLKVAVIASIDGVLRKKEKVLEETIEVAAAPTAEAEAPVFQTLSYFHFSNASIAYESISFDPSIGSDDGGGAPPVSPRISGPHPGKPEPAAPARPQPYVFTDPRDGRRYPTVPVKGLRWMMRNLSFDAGPGCCLPEGDPGKGAMYGRLYTWEAARAACPPGWRLPTDEEWQELALLFGGYQRVSDKRWLACLQHLLKRGVAGNPHGYFADDIPGFYAQYAGRKATAGYRDFQTSGFYWSASEKDGRSAFAYQFDRKRQLLLRTHFRKTESLSVRCVMPSGKPEGGSRNP